MMPVLFDSLPPARRERPICSQHLRLPPFAKCAKDGHPPVLAMPARSRALGTNLTEVSIHHRKRSVKPEEEFTLLELIIATAILLVLSTMVLPLALLLPLDGQPRQRQRHRRENQQDGRGDD
jgi:hypothetical protein